MIDTDQQRRTLAGAVRNMITAPGVIFSPWTGLDLTYRDGNLCKASLPSKDGERSYTVLCSQHAIYYSTDDNIWQLVMGGSQ